MKSRNSRSCGFPLGATWDGEGVNFALFSAHAEGVELCLYDPRGRETGRIRLSEVTDQVWHGYVPGLGPGARYAYRVDGPYEPSLGHRFNPHKLLIDPYARLLDRRLSCAPRHHAYVLDNPREDLLIDRNENADIVPKAVVVGDDDFDWGDDRPPCVPWSETVIYECHVGGMTRLHPDVPEAHRGRYLGMAHPAVLEHLRWLGVTAVELLPVQGFADEPFLLQKHLTNYWGYSPLTYFAPELRYSVDSPIEEFKTMVKALHAAGLEVILDVVYNHTFEGNHLGPSVSWRGIDNASYYRLQAHDKRFYIDDTGCGNSLNLAHPRVLQMVMDSLRYWVEEMHVDGFRFDLGSTLGREAHGFDRGSGFFDAIRQDPVLCRVKLIAEPWDVGPGGYQLGGFPAGWSEWNDRYRDTLRRFWRGDDGVLAEFARRLHGSSDLFEHDGRGPWAGVNFITSHDGFTLLDTVSYEERHNQANGENNRDGHHANFSSNYGVEGQTTDPEINAVRLRQMRNLLATLLFSQGTPMLLGGDELGRTQLGNNNAYCQDNEISWLDWSTRNRRELSEFTRELIRLRREHPVLRRPQFVHGLRCSVLTGMEDIRWINDDGEPMLDSQWRGSGEKFLGMLLCDVLHEENRERSETDRLPETLLLYFHAGADAARFRLPELDSDRAWQLLLSTDEAPGAASRTLPGGSNLSMPPRVVQAWQLINLAP